MKTLLFVVLFVEIGYVGAFPGNSSESFPYTETMVKDSYILHWKHNDTHITFETHVKTLGWIGIGISENGNMYPADVVIGWVKNGRAFLEDSHTTQYDTPIRDITDNWYLISGRETDDTTILKFERTLDTCDISQDRLITKDLMHVIYAWGESDPEPIPNKHTVKGARLLYLLDPITQEFTPPPDANSFVFSSIRVTIPPQRTYYHCTAFEFPIQESKQHAIAFEPVIERGNEDIVHHFLVMTCSVPFLSVDNGTSFGCGNDGRNAKFQSCYSVMAAWATGAKAYYFPSNVGMTIGDASGPKYYLLQVHYNNDKLEQGRIDSSGMRVVYTPTLRQHDAGMLQLGVRVNPIHVIPPGYNEFSSRGYCTNECLSEGMADGNPIYITAVTLHSHLLGRKLRLRHIRDGVEQKAISEDNNYDFDFQQNRQMRSPVMVKPTDTLFMECVYDSSDKVNATRGGLGTNEEMCLAFITYYPEMPRLTNCISLTTYNVGYNWTNIYRASYKSVAENDWTSVWDRLQFQCLVDRSDQYFRCFGKNNSLRWFAPVPKISTPYVAESKCHGNSKDPASDKDYCAVPSSATKHAAGFLMVLYFVLYSCS